GQMAVVVPLCLILSVGGTLLWGYVHMMHSQAASLRVNMGVNNLAAQVANRIRYFLAMNQGPDPTLQLPSCSTAEDAVMKLRAFRQMWSSSGPPAIPTNPSWTAVANTNPPAIPCILSPTEASTLGSYNISVTAASPPDTASYSMDVLVSVQLV